MASGVKLKSMTQTDGSEIGLKSMISEHGSGDKELVPAF